MSKAKNLLTAKRKVSSVAKLWLKRQKVRKETICYNQQLGQFHTFIDFKKIPDEEKLNAFKGLLKGMVPNVNPFHSLTSSLTVSVSDRNR
jgi:hypothetical protein